MIITISGNIATDLKAYYMQKNGQYLIDQATGQYLLGVDFYLAVDRKGKTRKGTDGKEYTADLYKVHAVGAKAQSLMQYGSKGRNITVSGQFLQDEWMSNQTVSIDKQHPLYATLAQYTQMANSPVVADQLGNLYFVAKAPTKAFVMNVVEYTWNGANPNAAATMAPSAYVPQGNTGAGFAPATPAIPGVPAVPGVPAMPGVPGVPAMPQTPAMPAMPGMPNVPFGQNATPSMPQVAQAAQVPQVPQVPQVGVQQVVPQAPQIGVQQVVPQQNPTASTLPNVPGFTPQQNVASTVGTNIPTPPVPETPVAPETASVASPAPAASAPAVESVEKVANFKPEDTENLGF